MSKKQARAVRDCGDSLITNLRSKSSIAASESILIKVNYHLPRLLDNNTSAYDWSVSACVAYLKYVYSADHSTSLLGDISRRFSQIWIHIHFENNINVLKEREKNGVPINRQHRALSTVARDSILQAFHRKQFSPRKADRDFLSDQCRWGERWLKIAASMGLGVILLTSKEFATQMYAHEKLS